MRNAQLLHGMEPLHIALDVVLVSRRTKEATVGEGRCYQNMKECDALAGESEYRAYR